MEWFVRKLEATDVVQNFTRKIPRKHNGETHCAWVKNLKKKWSIFILVPRAPILLARRRCKSDSGIVAISPYFGYPPNYFQWAVNFLFSFLQIRNLVKNMFIFVHVSSKFWIIRDKWMSLDGKTNKQCILSIIPQLLEFIH